MEVKLVASVIAYVLAFAAHADTLLGYVASIADGDILTVLDASRQQHKIRLTGIDAPEKRQPFGERSRRNLADLVFNKEVTVKWNKLDRYGRAAGLGWPAAGLETIHVAHLHGFAIRWKTALRLLPGLTRPPTFYAQGRCAK